MNKDGLPRRLILLAAASTYRSKPFEAAAERLGVEVVSGEDIPLPFLSRARADLPLDYRDLQKSTRQITAYAKENPVGAILGLDDSGTLLAAAASEALGLAHNSPEAAMAARSKHLMRQRFAAAGVPSPEFRYCTVDEDPETLAREVRYPCVLKPTTLAGSRGVMRADHPAEFLAQHKRLMNILAKERCGEFLVEDYLPGIEVALEGLLDDGELRVLALFDKPDPLEGPFFEETIYLTPSRLPQATQDEVVSAARQAAGALGLRNGPMHAELRINDGGVWLVEVAGRSIGGMCSQTLQFASQVSLEELILRQAFGLGIDEVKPDFEAAGVMMIPIPAAGLLKEVDGVEEAQAVEFITDVEITAKINHKLVPLPEGDSYLGFIFAQAETPAEVEAALRAAHEKLRFEVIEEIALEAIK
jgi:biotin carboxylase